MAEFEIQEDFLQISELVFTESISVYRSKSFGHTKQSSPKEFLTRYHGSPALCSEEIFASGQSVLSIYRRLKYYNGQATNYFAEIDFWILGANYNETLRIDAEDGVNCGEISCYKKSVENGQICKSGRFAKNECISSEQ